MTPSAIIPDLDSGALAGTEEGLGTAMQKFSQIYKISPDTNIYKTKHVYANIKHKILEELVPSVLPI